MYIDWDLFWAFWKCSALAALTLYVHHSFKRHNAALTSKAEDKQKHYQYIKEEG